MKLAERLARIETMRYIIDKMTEMAKQGSTAEEIVDSFNAEILHEMTMLEHSLEIETELTKLHIRNAESLNISVSSTEIQF